MSTPMGELDPGGPRRGPRVTTVTRGWRGLRWWFRGVVGADAYERYLERHARLARQHGHGHDHAPMTEREFWRARTDHQERHPQGRCC